MIFCEVVLMLHGGMNVNKKICILRNATIFFNKLIASEKRRATQVYNDAAQMTVSFRHYNGIE